MPTSAGVNTKLNAPGDYEFSMEHGGLTRKYLVHVPASYDPARPVPLLVSLHGGGGFMEFLEAVLDPTHEEHARMLEWYGGAFDPDDIDERRIRMVLSMFADRRKGPLASHRGGRLNNM